MAVPNIWFTEPTKKIKEVFNNLIIKNNLKNMHFT